MPAKAGLERRLKLFRDAETKLAPLRAAAYTSKLSGVQTEEGYIAIAAPPDGVLQRARSGHRQHHLLRPHRLRDLADQGRDVPGALHRHAPADRAGPAGGTTSPSSRIALTSYAYLEGIAIEEYVGGGTEADARKLQDAEAQIKSDGAAQAAEAKQKNPDYVPPPANPTTMVVAISTMQSRDGAERAALAEKGISTENWWAVTTLKYDAYRTDRVGPDRQGRVRGVGHRGRREDRRDHHRRGRGRGPAPGVHPRRCGGPPDEPRDAPAAQRRLRRRRAAPADAGRPALRAPTPAGSTPGSRPIPITTTDEIGEVARAFDQVHREAVRLAAEQALLRGNVNAIFTNLSRRNQCLIERQLTLITDLENNEADPDQLENLFKLDHLATRMRRNGENLLVLAGEEPGRRWTSPVPLVDVLRAAASEVEQYERIELAGVPEAEIHGRAVTDLVHLLAELLENATSFSSPQTKVRVTATRCPTAA